VSWLLVGGVLMFMYSLFPQVIMMKDYPHDNIVKFYASYLVGEELWVVMEFVEGGSLTNLLHKTRSVHCKNKKSVL